ncbi:hypothetical protein Mgra_00004956 [Meloidogyne graminicola]|uniref:Farnesyl pyrophosphate synthase n=1 Tax=Meloidogyne graminicola TaxID=189291 RepID=A0A8S9ZQX4_9BILA|nr:hypothetical protein Mgra_00004956 [Meloidogyne graminicola]
MQNLNMTEQNTENTSSKEIAFLDDEDDELPPPPPQNMLGNVVQTVVFRPPPILENSMENNFDEKNDEFPSPPPPISQFQYLPAGGGTEISTPSEGQSDVKNIPSTTSQDQFPPTLNVPPPPLLLHHHHHHLTKTFANSEVNSRKPSTTSNDGQKDNRSLLLIQIQEGVKLKKVQKQEEQAQKRAVDDSTDVAAILRKRMEHCFGGSSDSSSNSPTGLFKNGKFLNSLVPILRDELTNSLTNDLDESKRIFRLFDYNICGGKFGRSNLAMETFKALFPESTEENLINSGKVALTLEMLQTFYLIEDDIMDNSILRRGRPSWHTLPENGLTAINDGLLLESGINRVIQLAIPSHPRKSAILSEISTAKQKTVIGQMLDMITKDLSEFTWPRYSSIVSHKTSHYSYLLPLNIGMHLADYTTPHQVNLKRIAYKLGYLFQIQDDYLDCFGDPSITGKSNLIDLAEGKCTWITCALIEKIRKNNSSQLEKFKNNFCTQDEQKLIIARNIIIEQGIEEDCIEFQKKKISELYEDIMSYPIEPLRQVLEQTLIDITGRQK